MASWPNAKYIMNSYHQQTPLAFLSPGHESAWKSCVTVSDIKEIIAKKLQLANL